MADSSTSGCEQCRNGLRGYETQQPRRVTPHPKWPTALLHCEACGTWWEMDAHHPIAVSEEYARKEYPAAFADDT